MFMENIWAIEKQLWENGIEAVKELIDKDCVMIMPSPVSTKRGYDILKDSADFPQWDTVSFTDEDMVRRDHDKFIFLTYKMKAGRQEQSEYSVLCGSTYMYDGDGGYVLILHQQTPFG